MPIQLIHFFSQFFKYLRLISRFNLFFNRASRTTYSKEYTRETNEPKIEYVIDQSLKNFKWIPWGSVKILRLKWKNCFNRNSMINMVLNNFQSSIRSKCYFKCNKTIHIYILGRLIKKMRLTRAMTKVWKTLCNIMGVKQIKMDSKVDHIRWCSTSCDIFTGPKKSLF